MTRPRYSAHRLRRPRYSAHRLGRVSGAILILIAGLIVAGVPALAHSTSAGHTGTRHAARSSSRLPGWLTARSGIARLLTERGDNAPRWLAPLRRDVSAELASATSDSEVIIGVPVTVTGSLSVAFHGDAASGCAALSACGASGTLSWRPASSGELLSLVTGSGSHRDYVTTALVLEDESTTPMDGTHVQSVDATGATCSDTTSSGDEIPMPVSGATATLALDTAEPSLVTTRCLAPLASDVGRALGTIRASAAQLLAGHLTLKFPTSGTFTAGGFTGTVSSSIRLALGRPQVERLSAATAPPGSHPRHQPHYRLVAVTYRAQLSGGTSLALDADAGRALCTPVDSCGFTGTTTVRPNGNGVPAVWEAVVPAAVSEQRALRDLGLRSGRPNRQRLVTGEGVWAVGGTATTSISRLGQTCTNGAGIGPLATLFGSVRGMFGVALLDATYLGDAIGVGRTRCPGPFDHRVLFAEGFIPLHELRHRTVSVPLTLGGGYFSDDGWHGTARPDLRLTLVRESVKQRIVSASQLTLATR